MIAAVGIGIRLLFATFCALLILQAFAYFVLPACPAY